MNLNLLLPHKYKIIGLWIFIPTVILAVIDLFMHWELGFLDVHVFSLTKVSGIFEDDRGPGIMTENILNELFGIFLIIGGLLIMLSKEPKEDELILKIRLESLLWATIWSYGILFLSIIFIYGEHFFTVMLVNMFTVMVLFIVRFNWKLYQLRKMEGRNEE
jgi:hypothetical protein